jgi:hypothetical protein
MTDLGGNLDILASFRPSDALLLDLYDHPEDIKRLTWQAHEAWWRYFNELNAVLRPPNPGYTAWTPIFSESPYYMLQCDFCYMIGPDMFDDVCHIINNLSITGGNMLLNNENISSLRFCYPTIFQLNSRTYPARAKKEF